MPSALNLASMRNLGASLTDKGFFELDLGSGAMTWANPFALQAMGFTSAQVSSMSIFDLVPKDFHESVTNVISDTLGSRNHKYGIWPFRSADGGISWWYTVREKDSSPTFWYKAELLGRTDKSGREYVAMCLTMQTVNGYNDLQVRLDDHISWTKSEVEELRASDERVWRAIEEVKRIGRGAQAAAEKAANAAFQNDKSIKDLDLKLDEGFSKQTGEIIRLINNDVGQDQRLKAFETGMDQAAAAAVSKATAAIVKQTERAGDAITVRATEAGKGLSKKVSVPVGIIATVMTIIQFLFQIWMRRGH